MNMQDVGLLFVALLLVGALALSITGSFAARRLSTLEGSGRASGLAKWLAFPGFEGVLRNRLKERFKQGQTEAARLAALDLLIRPCWGDKYGAESKDIVVQALSENSRTIRERAIQAACQYPKMAAVEVLESHMPKEADPDLRRSVTAAILMRYWRHLTKFLEEADFDQAEALCRKLLVVAPDNPSVKSVFERLPVLRERAVQRETAENEAKRIREAARLADAAGEKFAAAAFESAEELALQALASHPDNQHAKEIITQIPEARTKLDLLKQAKNESELVDRIERLKTQASDEFNRCDYEAASETLLKLVPLCSSDEWACKTLEKLPSLQQQKRIAAAEGAENLRQRRVLELSERIQTLLLGKDSLTEAEEAATELLSLDPANDQYRRQLSSIASMREQQKARGTRDTLFEKARKAMDSGGFDTAEEHLNKLLPMEPQSERVQSLLTALPDLRRRTKQAEDTARGDQIFQQVAAALNEGRLDDAERHLNELLPLEPETERVRSVVAAIPELRRRHEEVSDLRAVDEVLTKVKELSTDVADALNGDHHDRALAKACELMTLVPGDAEYVTLVENVKRLKADAESRRDADATFREVQTALQAEDFPKVHLRLQALLSHAPWHTEGKILLDQLPDIQEKSFRQHKLEERIKNQKRAEDACNEAAKMFERGDESGAIQKLRKAAALDPQNDHATALLKRIIETERLIQTAAQRRMRQSGSEEEFVG